MLAHLLNFLDVKFPGFSFDSRLDHCHLLNKRLLSSLNGSVADYCCG